MSKVMDGQLLRRIEKYIKPTEDGCIVWTGARFPAGYGQIRYQGSNYGVHRLLYELVHGKLPPKTVVRHKCDNKLCIKLAHLISGTYKDNRDDAVNRGRLKNTPKILSEETSAEIKSRYWRGRGTMPSLAKEYGVSVSTIKRCVWGGR